MWQVVNKCFNGEHRQGSEMDRSEVSFKSGNKNSLSVARKISLTAAFLALSIACSKSSVILVCILSMSISLPTLLDWVTLYSVSVSLSLFKFQHCSSCTIFLTSLAHYTVDSLCTSHFGLLCQMQPLHEDVLINAQKGLHVIQFCIPCSWSGFN